MLCALEGLLEHIKDERTDAHWDFYPSKIEPIEKCMEMIKNSKEMDFQEMVTMSEILGFSRVFPLLELAEIEVELRKTVLKKQSEMIASYEKWGLNNETLSEIKKKYAGILKKSVWEGVFRKGISISESEAWKPIIYNKGGRTVYEYIDAVITGWMHEDVISQWFFEKLGSIRGVRSILVTGDAHDKDRIFKYKKLGKAITGEPDYKVELMLNGNKKTFVAEIQHVTNRSIKKRKGLVQVPGHRVKESKKWRNGYLFIVPYVNENSVEKIAIIPGPLKEVEVEFIRQPLESFFGPDDPIDMLSTFIRNLDDKT